MPFTISPKGVAVITGAGGMGLATARRISAGRTLLLADCSEAALSKAKSQLEDEGHYSIETHNVDVADAVSVSAFAEAAQQAGRVDVVVHTAGVSPATASPKKIFDIDLLGTALVIDAFQSVYAQLLNHESARGAMEGEQAGLAYQIAKRANILRVQAAALEFGRRGCRINSISPGVIHTAMGMQELTSPAGQFIQQLAESAPLGRYGTAADIVNVVSWLLSQESSFVTGADLLVDGGLMAAQRWAGEGKKADVRSYDRR